MWLENIVYKLEPPHHEVDQHAFSLLPGTVRDFIRHPGRESGFSRVPVLMKTLFAHRRNNTQKVHVLLLGYARSGSSLVGNIIQSQPSSFYHFEPLYSHRHKLEALRVSPDQKFLKDLFTCSFADRDTYLRFVKNNLHQISYQSNIQYMNVCQKGDDMSPCFRSETHVIKTIRLSLKNALQLSRNNPDLDLKIIYLVRDPRAIMHSRWYGLSSLWCRKASVCYSLKKFCQNYKDDVEEICKLNFVTKQNLLVLRYEDLVYRSYGTTLRIFKFLGFEKLSNETVFFIEKYLQRHPNNSLKKATQWLESMNISDILSVEQQCSDVFNKLQYPQLSKSGYKWNVFEKYQELEHPIFC
ncbi:carbohydrate sulfotransferase 4-like [Tachypleus tridentatus]|uniref:carbohydrate sulfotransferase 4-like n=1 Tax=Tachypleus tridentatus TaxID=6853 RepID=UPI003FD503B9